MQPTVLNDISAKFRQETEDHIPVTIPFNNLSLHAHLYMPQSPEAVVIISHGTGSSRFSAKNNHAAQALSDNNIVALLVDLLTPKEDSLIENWFKIPLLAERLKHITKWLMQYPGLKDLPVGYLGVGTGAAADLTAAVELKDEIRAVVCRSGRPDLVKPTVLSKVECPTLFIVGGLDAEIIKLNTKEFQNLTCKKSIIVVNSASHAFEEPGKLHIVCEVAGDWFEKYLF